MNRVKKLKRESTELPDCIISYIFSKLSLKNLVKTSVLSKQWYHEWGLKKDLKFDLFNMFDYDTIPDSPITLPLFQQLQSQFAASLDTFMHKYPGDTIRSIQVSFPLGVDHTYAIDGLIHNGLLKGVNRIELLLANKTNFKKPYITDLKIEPYKFLFPFLSGPNSLTYLHLQNCHIAASMKFSGLKNLTTLVLTRVPVEQNMLQDLCFNCIRLENFTLNQCCFLSHLKITSPTLLHLNINCKPLVTMPWNIDIISPSLLYIEYSPKFFPNLLPKVKIDSPMLSKLTYRSAKLFNLEFSRLTNVTTIVLDRLCEDDDAITHLFSKCLQLEDVTLNMCRFTSDVNIISAKLRHLSLVHCYHRYSRTCKIDIHALNLSSFQYRGYKHMRSMVSLEAPKLLKVFWDAGFNQINVYNFSTTSRLHQHENFAMPMTLSQISKLTNEYLIQYPKLTQLELFTGGAYNPNMDNFWILDIAMASQDLLKLSLTISYSTL
ncbi:unnamed protein product [Lathyrus sativus]|nr:unnamed protein product [Lathyrus sativus]